MSTRIEVPHPAQKRKHNKAHKKMPTMEKAGKIANILSETNDKRQQIASSIENRARFLHNTAMNNKRNELNRLTNIYATGVQPFANDGRFYRLTENERRNIGLRTEGLRQDITNAQPIIGNQARYQFV